jgi:N6-adenosine-specific RNA methylase IME4
MKCLWFDMETLEILNEVECLMEWVFSILSCMCWKKIVMGMGRIDGILRNCKLI